MTVREHGSNAMDVHRARVSDDDLRGLLTDVSRLVAGTVPQVDAASLTLGSPGEPGLVAASSALAQAGDGMQFLASAGPSFDAFRAGRPVRTDDLADDERWPSLRQPGPDGERPRSALVLPMLGDGAVIGVVTLYAVRAGGFGDEVTCAVAPLVATLERLVRDEQELTRLRVTNEQLAEALTSRPVIDQAKGMIMLTERCGPDEAFAVLRRASMRSNRKLRDVAVEIVSTAGAGGRPAG